MDYSFPWNKVDVAKKWLYAVKPWWRRYGERFTIHPFSVPPAPNSRYGGLCFSTYDWKIFIDSSMANAVSVEVLAGCIERELHRAVRNIPARMGNASQSDMRTFGHVAAELEICSVMRQEYNSIGNVDNDYFVTMEFADSLKERWDITDIPHIEEEMAFYPESFSFPDLLTMEEYFILLAYPDDSSKDEDNENNEEKENNDSSDDNSQNDSSSEDNEENHSESEESQDDGESDDNGESSESVEDTSKDENGNSDEQLDNEEDLGESEENQDNGESGGDSSSANSSDSESNDNSDPQNNNADSSDSDSSDNGQNDSSQSDNQDGQNGDDNSSGEAGQDSSSETEFIDTGDDRNYGGAGGGAARDEETPSAGNALEELLESPDRSWYTRDYEPPETQQEEDIFATTTRDPVALEELSQDVAKAMKSSRGTEPGNGLIEILGLAEGTGKSWESHFENAVAHTIGEFKVFGGQDLSYSVRNPNQPEFGAILMGMYDTAPTITVIMDTSYSMKSFLGHSLNTFADIVLTVVSGTGMPVTWISVDTDVQSVGEVHSVSDINKLSTEITKGFGGTDIGHVIQNITSGDFDWKGTRLEAPDIIIVCTDCEFPWPWQDNSVPDCDSLILVSSVLPYKEAQDWLPQWVKEDENFIMVE